MGEEKTQGPEAAAKIENRSSSHRPILLFVAAVLVGAALGGTGVWWSMHGHGQGSASDVAPSEAKKAPLYRCPMHPAITSDHPGDCPICGMKLVLVAPSATDGEGATKAGERKILFYRSPMNPKQTSPVPRKDEMGMGYLPVHEDELAQGGEAKVSGMAAVTIDPSRQQLIGLRTAKVSKGSVGGTWHTVARIEVAPSHVRKTNVKIEGFVERVFVDFVGQIVRKGQPLFSIYSPALLAAQNEYLLALQTKESLAKGGALTENGDSLVTSARRRLELWDVPASEIARLTSTREPSKTLTLVSPIAGVVTAKNVVQGARLGPGEAPYEITDLGEVWAMADAYESDLTRIQVGMKALLTLAAYPERTFSGQVAFIDPVFDPKTRTVKVHMHFMNPKRELKPEMFGEVTLQGVTRDGLRVPADAVIRAGNQDVIFLASGAGKFEPRVVQIGAKIGDEVEVTGGLELGQEVVTRANFLVDSESQLRASLAAIGGR
jgi:Cu(I)/Ag(I) efflux system membrane fusion protein